MIFVSVNATFWHCGILQDVPMYALDIVLDFEFKLALRIASISVANVVHFACNFLFNPIVIVDSL
jgi:hypothetical protein